MIDEKKLIEIIESYRGDIFASEIVELIKQMPTVADSKWIPCNERLPEDDNDVLIFFRDKDKDYLENTGIDISQYREETLGGRKLGYKRWRSPFDYFRSNYEVIAWQPLPPKYNPNQTRI